MEEKGIESEVEYELFTKIFNENSIELFQNILKIIRVKRRK